MANLTVDQLKKLKISLPASRCGTSMCPSSTSIYDILTSFFATNSYIVYSDATLSGNGTSVSPIKISQQSATSGQVLTWNGTTWTPQNPIGTIQTLTLVGDDITLSGGGGTIPVEDLISTDASNTLVAGTDGLLFVDTVISSLPTADTAGQIAYWTGSAWSVALEYTNEQSPSSGNQVTLPHTPISNLPVRVYLNGVLLRATDDYTRSSATLTFTFNFSANDKVTTTYYN